MKASSLLLALASLVVLGGCAAKTENDPSTDDGSTDDDLTAASVLASTFTITGKTDDTRFNSLTMKADHTFTATGGCRQDTTGPHCFAITSITGKWKTAKSGPQLGSPGGAAQLVFTDSLDQVDTFFYSLTNDQLSLSQTFRGTASHFDRDLSKLKKLKEFDTCADKYSNSLGECPEESPCEYNGPTGPQQCLPPI